MQARGELALIPLIFVNSFAVVLMLYSGSGISAISSVPYVFNQVFPRISLGTWTYIISGSFSGCFVYSEKEDPSALPAQFCGRLFLRHSSGSS